MIRIDGVALEVLEINVKARLWALVAALLVASIGVAYLVATKQRAVKLVQPRVYIDFSRADQVLEIYDARLMRYDSERGVWIMEDAAGDQVGEISFEGAR